MSRRDPEALDRLTVALAPAAARVRDAAAAAQQRRAYTTAVAAVPRLSLWVGVLTLGTGCLTAVPMWAPPLAALLLAVAVFGLSRSRMRPPGAILGEGALACDRAHANQDRLSAACELAAAPPRGEGLGEGLAHAAIEDGVRSLARIDAQRLQLAAASAPPSPFAALCCLLGLAVLPWLIPGPGDRAPTTTTTAGAPVPPLPPAGAPAGRADHAGERQPAEVPGKRVEEERKDTKDGGAKVGAPPPPPKPAAPAPAVPAASGQGQSGSDATGDSSQDGAPKAAPAGNPGSGQSGGGQGSSASGAPEPTPTPPSQKAPPKPKKPQPQRQDPQQDGKSSESAGAPSGPSRGSGRLAAVGNKRTDQNRGQEREDDPQVEDEPIEDETDEQEQRGGVMPMRRGDNRPAARELSISGDGPPDQGRGGPTPPKKARGTASLVLGLRLPDSVRGQPNPGTAKTTLEQIPPRPSTADAGLARALPGGRPTTPQSPRPVSAFAALQQAYHALLRARDSAPTQTPNPTATPPAESKDPK